MVRLNRRLHKNLIKLRNTVDISSKRIRSLDKANRRTPKPPKGLAKAWVLLKSWLAVGSKAPAYGISPEPSQTVDISTSKVQT